MVYISLLEIDDLVDIDKAQDIKAISSLQNNTAEIFNNENGRDDLYSAQMEFLEHVGPNLIIGIENESHLPDPVFPYIKPTMGVHILFHIMILMVQFKTKIYFIANNALREILCYAKCIGSSNEPGEIVGYSNALIC